MPEEGLDQRERRSTVAEPPASAEPGAKAPPTGGFKERRRLAETVGAYGTSMIIVGLVSGVAPPPINWLVAVIGVIVALAHYFLGHLRKGTLRPRGERAVVFLVSVAMGAFGFVGGLLSRPLMDYGWNHMLSSCEVPVEVSVLLPVDGAFGFEAAVNEFNDRYTDEAGCKLANVTAYAAPWPDVKKAMQLGWETDRELDRTDPLFDFNPLRDVGPRPDLWLAESMTQIELVEAPLVASAAPDDVLEPAQAEPIGSTPLVVAVPQSSLGNESNPDGQVLTDALPDLISRLREEQDVAVVRSDPNLSYTALAFLDALYAPGTEADLVGTRVENQLARSVEETGLALPGTDTDLLCAVAGLEPELGVAVLTTERALSRYNEGEPLGTNCPLRADARSGLSPIYLESLGSLDYHAAQLHWDDPWAEKRLDVVERLTAWLQGDDGRWSPERIGIRGNDYGGEELDGAVDFVPSFAPTTERLEAADHDRLLVEYGDSRVPTDVLLAIDRSLSMGTAIDGEGRTRFELAIEGVRAALGYLSPRDSAGLWTFPAAGGPSHTELLEIATGRSPTDAELLQAATDSLVSGIDLHQTIVAGMDALDAASADEGVEAMVVLTDGADRDDSDVTVDDVVARVAASEASLYIIAVGDASCRAKHFADMTAHARITCLEAGENQVRTTFEQLFAQLWS